MKQCTECNTIYINETEVCENCGIEAGDYTDLFREDTSTIVDIDNSQIEGEYKLCNNCGIYYSEDVKICASCGCETSQKTFEIQIDQS